MFFCDAKDWIFTFPVLTLGTFRSKIQGEAIKIMRPGWQFLSWRWWLVHFLGFTLVYAAGRLTATWLKG